ncbi:MAG: hypothetical protein E6Q97_14140 [Desulfurellales bacterium]|nr:MAG: hypothetical protein E6Q97_14140 [Desulfurellales bacterium]
MPGFWTQTEAGHTVHINGDPDMSAETRQALCAVMDAVAKQYEGCSCVDTETIHIAHWGAHYTFVVQRCRQCRAATVEVWAKDANPPMLLATLPTRIAPYASNRPLAGNAYYWHFQGLNHSTRPIAPMQEELTP